MTASRSLSRPSASPVVFDCEFEPLRHQPREVALPRSEPFAERADAPLRFGVRLGEPLEPLPKVLSRRPRAGPARVAQRRKA